MTRAFIMMTLLRIFGMVLSLAYSLLLARMAGPDAFAIVQLFLNFSLFASLLLTAGFESVTVRFGSQYWRAGNVGGIETIYAQARKSILVHGMILAGVIVFLVAIRLDTPLTSNWLIASYIVAGTVLVAFNAIHRDLLRASDRTVASMASQNVVRSLFPFIVTLIIVAISPTLLTDQVNLTICLTALTLGFFFELFLLRPLRLKLLSGLQATDARHKSYAKRIFVGDMAHIGVYRLSSLAVGLFFDLRVAALFFAAERIAQMSQFIVEGVHISSGPSIAVAAESGERQKLQDAISHASLLAFLTGIPLMIAVAIAGRFVLGLFGPTFTAAYPELLILLLGYGAMSLVGPTPMFGNMTGLEKQRAWLTYAALMLVLAATGLAMVMDSILVAACGVAFSLLFLHLGMAFMLWHKFKVISGPLGFRKDDIRMLSNQCLGVAKRILRPQLYKR